MKIKLTRTHEFMKDLQVGKVYEVAKEESMGVIVIDDTNENNFIDKGFYEVVEEEVAKTILEEREYTDCWQGVKDATMNTINKNKGAYPDSDWKRKLLMSEHSPIRKIKMAWRWLGIKYFVSVHITRHWLGITHFVGTQRTDRTGINRDDLPQGNLVNHECEANAQALINVSRKRLCFCASKETREAWQQVKDYVGTREPELAQCMVKECVYRNGLCPEMFSCGYNKSPKFEEELKEYTNIISSQINSKTNINFIK